MNRCKICDRMLDNPDDPMSQNCGETVSTEWRQLPKILIVLRPSRRSSVGPPSGNSETNVLYEIKHNLAGNKAYLGRAGMARGCEEAGELRESHVDGDGTRLGESSGDLSVTKHSSHRSKHHFAICQRIGV